MTQLGYVGKPNDLLWIITIVIDAPVFDLTKIAKLVFANDINSNCNLKCKFSLNS